MKHVNLYIKLFVSLLLLIIALQVYFFIDLNFQQEGLIHPERNKNRAMKIQVLKELIEENVRRNNGFARAKEDIQKIISRNGRLYEAKIWIENSNGVPLLESFSPEDRPPKIPQGYTLYAIISDVTIIHLFQGGHKNIYTSVPFDPQMGDGLSLHIFSEGELGNYRERFLIGLAGIILIMAVFALSVLQFIRVKVNRFRKSVLRIADGDLDHRFDVKGRGVVEDLGRSFNTMTDKLEKMIASSKEITANVSHEIRTPLGRIRVVEDLLRRQFERGDFSGYERHLDNIREDIQILDDLTGRLLEFIKLDNHERIENNEEFNPAEMINDLLLRFEPIIESKRLNIRKDILFTSSCSGDRSAIISAFLNILDNAVKYTPEHGNITIIMRSDQGFWETSITNSFDKLDQQELNNIFKPFERLRQSNISGSGLGLAITKKIVEKHGGHIIASNSKEGFEIRVRLPVQ
jgi:two-component system, OmpR family, sensor histidine kinase CpxA